MAFRELTTREGGSYAGTPEVTAHMASTRSAGSATLCAGGRALDCPKGECHPKGVDCAIIPRWQDAFKDPQPFRVAGAPIPKVG